MLWCRDGIKHFSDVVYYIKPNIILDNLYYDKINVSINDDSYYKSIYEGIKVNGWDVEYPAVIGIGNRGEIFIYDGNHRINMINSFRLNTIPFKFIYLTDFKPSKIPTYLENGKSFYPNGLLPKWKPKRFNWFFSLLDKLKIKY